MNPYLDRKRLCEWAILAAAVVVTAMIVVALLEVWG